MDTAPDTARWGLDIGGTKLEAAVIGRADDKLVTHARLRIATEASHGYEHILERIALLLGRLEAHSGTRPTRLGVGHPGSVDPRTGLIRNSNTLCLNGRALGSDLEHRLGIPCTLSNDANCFALAEALHGAGQGHRCVFGVIMGTGVGGGIVYAGEALQGRQGLAGEWGHNPLLPDGPACYCGARGCVETALSGPALERFYEQLAGQPAALEQIVAAARSRTDNAAVATVERLLDCFGEAIAVVVNILDPDCIVLGGGLSKIDALYLQGPTRAARHVFHERPDLKIVRNRLGDSAGVFGAALL